MLSKKSVKILSVVLLVVMLLITLGSTVMAAVTVPTPTDATPTPEINNTVSKILGFIQWGGIVAAVIVAMFIGIKYITSAPDGKAEIKKTIGYYIAGIVLLLSASGIVTVIQNNLTIS